MSATVEIDNYQFMSSPLVPRTREWERDPREVVTALLRMAWICARDAQSPEAMVADLKEAAEQVPEVRGYRTTLKLLSVIRREVKDALVEDGHLQGEKGHTLARRVLKRVQPEKVVTTSRALEDLPEVAELMFAATVDGMNAEAAMAEVEATIKLEEQREQFDPE